MKNVASGQGVGGARALAMLAMALTLVLAAGSVAAGMTNVQGTAYARPVWPGYMPGYPVMYPTYLYPGACLPYGTCADAWWAERRPWRRPVAPSQPPVVEQDIWGSTGSPWGYVRRIPPPTPQNQIQPRYQDASTIRPEFGGP